MKLTPMDINNKEFKRGLRGYNAEEVDEFLDEVIENYEELFKENAKMKERLSAANDKIAQNEKIETTIQNTLVLAQHAADQAKENAQREAEMTLKNANDAAKKIMDKAHSDVIIVNDEYESIKQEFIKFRAKFRNFMNTQLETFDELEKDVLKNYDLTKPVDSEAEEKIENNQETEEVDKETKTKLDLSEENVKSIENDSFKDDINEIKSFFANPKEDK